jgi:beta-mannosidase
MAAGAIPNPYLDDNEAALTWTGRTSWAYRTSFEADAGQPDERLDLVCEGLDTMATVLLNGTVLGTTANMHRTYRFDARPALVPGRNELEVRFEAPVDAAERLSAQLGPRPCNNPHPFNAIRKMACNYGWDWGPVLPTAGIWRPIYLERWRTARTVSVRPLVSVELGTPAASSGPEPLWADASSPRIADATVTFHIDIERAGGDDAALALAVKVGDVWAEATVEAGACTAVVPVRVPEARLWWPSGYGDQPLYDTEVHLRDGAGALLDLWRRRTGIRSVELDTRSDDIGTRLGFVVNGRAIFVRGANWIPDDCFPSRLGPERYRRRLLDARDANINLLRVWGGGIYESEDFYRAADELGLLVWQDFLLACAAYAEEEPLRTEFEAEAREAVTRLCAHPSLAVWSGGNENLWGYADWGWQEVLEGRTWGAGYYFELFPAIVAELDPTRPYMAGSPCSLQVDAHPNDPRHGSMHVWDVWNSQDYAVYRQHRPRFVAEFGFVGPAAMATLAGAVTERPLSQTSPTMQVHQKAVNGMEKMDRWLALHLPVPTSFSDWHWATSLNQVRAITVAVEFWRSLAPDCRGMVLWQLNDCWPVMSWAAVDGDGRYKPLWYALRRLYAPRLLTVQPSDEGLSVCCVNDGDSTWDTTVEVSRQDFAGNVVARQSLALRAPVGHAARAGLAADVARTDRPQHEVLVATAGDQRALWFYAEDKDLALLPDGLSARAEQTTGGYDVIVEAATLQRDVALLADQASADASVDEMLVTLLPGQSARFRVRSEALARPEALLRPPVLRSANQLLA